MQKVTSTTTSHRPLRRENLTRMPLISGIMKDGFGRKTNRYEQFVSDMEKESRKRGRILSREEEFQLFEIYSKLSARKKGLMRLMEKANGEREKLERKLRVIEKDMNRIANIVVMSIYGLIRTIAWQMKVSYKAFNSEHEDLINEGVIGAIKTVDRFKHERGFRFSTYATWYVRQAIASAIMNKDKTVRLSVNACTSLMAIHRCIYDYQVKKKRQPTIEEISEKTGRPIERVKQLLSLKPFAPLQELDKNTPGSYSDTIGHMVSLEMQVLATNLFQKLNPQEKYVIQSRFGNELTLAEIGEALDRSRERVRQIESKALAKMKRAVKRESIEDPC